VSPQTKIEIGSKAKIKDIIKALESLPEELKNKPILYIRVEWTDQILNVHEADGQILISGGVVRTELGGKFTR